jgi:hypothetical protein
MRSTDLARSAGPAACPFDVELQGFVGKCQVHSAAAVQDPSALYEIAGRLANALPRPQTCAEFLLLRSILAEFAAHALQSCGVDRTSAVILPLVQLQPPHGDLAAAFLRCMHAPVLPRRTAVPIADLRVGRAISVITARLADPACPPPRWQRQSASPNPTSQNCCTRTAGAAFARWCGARGSKPHATGWSARSIASRRLRQASVTRLRASSIAISCGLIT